MEARHSHSHNNNIAPRDSAVNINNTSRKGISRNAARVNSSYNNSAAQPLATTSMPQHEITSSAPEEVCAQDEEMKLEFNSEEIVVLAFRYCCFGC